MNYLHHLMKSIKKMLNYVIHYASYIGTPDSIKNKKPTINPKM